MIYVYIYIYIKSHIWSVDLQMGGSLKADVSNWFYILWCTRYIGGGLTEDESRPFFTHLWWREGRYSWNPTTTNDKPHFQVGEIWKCRSGWWQLKYFLCSPLFGEDSQFDRYFSDGLKPPTGDVFFLRKCHCKKLFFGGLHNNFLVRFVTWLVVRSDSQGMKNSWAIHSCMDGTSLFFIFPKKVKLKAGWSILLMAEILHHLGCMKPYK